MDGLWKIFRNKLFHPVSEQEAVKTGQKPRRTGKESGPGPRSSPGLPRFPGVGPKVRRVRRIPTVPRGNWDSVRSKPVQFNPN